jgi:nitrogen fixation NifU-like protein
MDNNLKRSIIMDHASHPRNKGLFDDPRYIVIDANTESCNDDIKLMVLIEDSVIKDVYFDGEACAICTSSTSIMIDILIGKTIDEARQIYKNFDNMINEKPYDSKILKDAIVYDDIYKQPNRKKCALLPWWGIEKAMKIEEK